MVIRQLKHVGTAACALSALVVMATVLWAEGAEESSELVFDRAKMHALAIEESLQPIRPGVPGKVLFWNPHATSFIYAPAFDFKPVPGAKSYRFIVTAYGPPLWKVESTEPKASLESIWKDVPDGKTLVKLMYHKGKWRDSKQAAVWSEKKAGIAAPTMDFNEEADAEKYRITVQSVKTLTFEADVPWAALTPVWKDVTDGMVDLTIEGLDRKGGKRIGLAVFEKGRQKRKIMKRQFERRVVFNGPYHESAIDYLEAGKRWLEWQAQGTYKWKREGKPGRLGRYPCKEEASAVKGLTALALLGNDPARKKELLQKARNAARTLIKGSFPADWGLAYMAPTYGTAKKYTSVVMTYPSDAGHAYLDLYEATKEKEFLDAAVRIADVYKRTQLPSGSWPLLMDAETGKKSEKSKTCTMPTKIIEFLHRLVIDHDLTSYQPLVETGWKWIETDVLPQFRFEGQFEDTVASRGGDLWHLSHHTADAIIRYLLRYRSDDPAVVALAEKIVRWSEDQFIFWEMPRIATKVKFTPCGEEQHGGNLDFAGAGYSTEAGSWIAAYQALYEATGKEVYLAKAVTFANAMTFLQKTKFGGNYVSTNWGEGKGSGGWPNCHTFNAKTLIKLGQMLQEKNMHVTVNPNPEVKNE